MKETYSWYLCSFRFDPWFNPKIIDG
jgi:hypothetical protein